MNAPIRTGRAYGKSVGFGVLCIVYTLLSIGCTTTLDPSVFVGDGGGDAGTTGVELAPCTEFASGDSQYLLCEDDLAFAAAAHDCALRDATLVAVGTMAEDDLVATTVRASVSGDSWLGGTRDEALVWSWPDGTVFWRGGPDGTPENGSFVHWKAGEPNDGSTTSPDPERCLARTPALDWNDRACELALPYVCERPLAGG